MSGYTEAHLAALEAALASGALRVKSGDQDITYRSIAELREAIAAVKATLGVAGGRRAFYQPTFERGF
jgi:hypothetical protein